MDYYYFCYYYLFIIIINIIIITSFAVFMVVVTVAVVLLVVSLVSQWRLNAVSRLSRSVVPTELLYIRCLWSYRGSHLFVSLLNV